MSSPTFEKNVDKINEAISKAWDNGIVHELINYIKIPNKSVLFDADWKAHGYMDEAMALVVDWCKQQLIKDMKLEVVELPKRTPLLFIEIPGQLDKTVLLYGHIDKQPEMSGWDDDLGPWKPVIKGDKLYGRGGADDGYAVFASLTAIAILQQYKIPHARCVIIIEASEESGSVDLPFYLEHLKDRIGNPNFVVCLDTGGANYDQLWCTTSLRGTMGGQLKIEVLKNGIHSGIGSGVVPSPFLVLRQLLDRIEDSRTSAITVNELKANIPKQEIEQVKKIASVINSDFIKMFPLLPNVKPISSDITELLLNNTWRAQLSVIGIDGLPSVANAGSVSIPSLTVNLSVRLAPTTNAQKASRAFKAILEKDPPYGAKISFHPDKAADGWVAPPLSDWLAKTNQTASMQFFGKPAVYVGVGGTIPFMGMLGRMFPEAQFTITGVLGPESNAHGPNEFLHIPTGKKLTGCVASMLASHYDHYSE